MRNLYTEKLANYRALASLLIGAALAPAVCAQTTRQLQVEVGPNQQVSIQARDVSFGEVLRTLQKKLGWEIEIPAIADELKLPFMHIESMQPQSALVKLLEGSRLGYAFLGEANGSRHMKVIVVPLAAPEAKATENSSSNPLAPDSGSSGASLTPSVQPNADGISHPTAVPPETTLEPPPAQVTMPLADALNAIGVPPGVDAADVGKARTFPISEAARIMGFPPGVAPADVGKTITMPLPAAGKRP